MTELCKKETRDGAIVTLRILSADYGYLPFDGILSERERRNFDGMLDSGVRLSGLSRTAFERYAVRYVASLVESEDERTAERLSALRDLYRHDFPRLSGKVNGWLFDYLLSKGEYDSAFDLCKGRGFPLPFERDYRIGRLLDDVKSGVYRSDTEEKLMLAILAMSQYNFTESRYYTGNEDTFKAAMGAAVFALLREVHKERNEELFDLPERTERRCCYIGLPCRSECSRTVEITYIPYSEGLPLCELVTSAVQYTENLVRQGLGVNVKLPVGSLLSEYRKICSEAVREELPGFLPAPAKVGRKPKVRSEKTEKEVVKEAERSEPISLDIDFSRAKRLEAESWRLASVLGGDYGVGDISYTPNSEDTSSGIAPSTDASDKPEKTDEVAPERVKEEEFADIPEDWRELFSSLSESEIAFLSCIAKGGDVEAFARSKGAMALGLCDSINEKASDTYGDIIIDTSGTALSFFEEYKDELYEILG